MKQSDDKTYKIAVELIRLYSAGLYGTNARCPVCLELVASTRKLERCSCGSLMIDAGGAYFCEHSGEWAGVRWVYDAERICQELTEK